MGRPAHRAETLTVEDYLRLEETAEVRHEYVAGQVHALAGASKRHNLIAVNIMHALRLTAARGPCRVYTSDVKLKAAADVIYYPDVMVACGPDEGGAYVEEAPCLVVEVASPSTAATDRREKRLVYGRTPTLGAYLVVEQDGRRVERHWRDAGGAWKHEVIEGSGSVPLPCPEGSLELAAIYDGTGVEA